MEILEIEQTSIEINCYKHPNNRVQFIQTKEINNDKKLFFCQYCVDEEEIFQIQNYLLVDRIEVNNENQIIDKWPPLDDNSLYKKLQQCTSEDNQIQKFSQKIECYYEQLKSEIIQKIDEVKQQMMSKSQKLPSNSKDVQEAYQDLSQIKILKKILLDTNMDAQQKENRFRDFIKKIECQKQNNTEIFKSLVSKNEKNQNLMDFKSPEIIKPYIIQLIDHINFFTFDKNHIHSVNNNQNQNNSQINIKLLFDLISTKSNYCSQIFLASVNSLLNQFTPLIDQVSFEDAFIQDKRPIDFSKLNNNQLELVRDLSEHLTRISHETEQEALEMKNIGEIKEIMSVLALKSNYLKQDFLNQFEEYLIQTYPPFNKSNFDTIFLENQKIQAFQDISDETLDNIVKLTQRINEIQKYSNDIPYQTLRIKEYCYYFQKLEYKQVELDKLYKNYPIFDLLKPYKQIDILPSIQMMKTNWKQSQQLKIEKNTNNQISISLPKNFNDNTNCVSDLILDENSIYVFRFQFINDSKDEKNVMIGLVRDSQKDSNYGCIDYLTCHFNIYQNQIQQVGSYGIEKKEKGDFSIPRQLKEIEMRVCINEGILQILDYPDYNNILSIADQYKKNLKEYQKLRLYIGIYQSNIKIEIIDGKKIIEIS